MQNSKLRIFISHGWEDNALAQRLEAELSSAGVDVWIDLSGIRVGDNLPKRINDALEWCNTLLLIWSFDASNSRWVELEWTNAVALERAIIPCRLDETKLPAILANKAYLDFRDAKQGIRELLHALNLAHQPMLPALDNSVEKVAHVLYNQLTGSPVPVKPKPPQTVLKRSWFRAILAALFVIILVAVFSFLLRKESPTEVSQFATSDSLSAVKQSKEGQQSAKEGVVDSLGSKTKDSPIRPDSSSKPIIEITEGSDEPSDRDRKIKGHVKKFNPQAHELVAYIEDPKAESSRFNNRTNKLHVNERDGTWVFEASPGKIFIYVLKKGMVKLNVEPLIRPLHETKDSLYVLACRIVE